MITETNFTQTVRNMRRRTTRLEREGDYWSTQEIDQLKTSFNEGIGITEMAIRLQRTEPAVIQQIEKLDLYQRKDNPRRRRKPRQDRRISCGACPVDPCPCPNCQRDRVRKEGK